MLTVHLLMMIVLFWTSCAAELTGYTSSNGNFILYHGATRSYTFKTANTYCQTNLGTTLATITNSNDNEEINDLRNLLVGYTTGSQECKSSVSVAGRAVWWELGCWIGLTRDIIENELQDWYWYGHTGTPFNFSDWAAYERSDSKSELCVTSNCKDEGSAWNDMSCTRPFECFVCNTHAAAPTPTPTTASPTAAPTVVTTSLPTSETFDHFETTSESDSLKSGNSSKNSSESGVVTIVAVLGSLLALCVLVGGFLLYRNRSKRKMRPEEDQTQTASNVAMVPANDLKTVNIVSVEPEESNHYTLME